MEVLVDTKDLAKSQEIIERLTNEIADLRADVKTLKGDLFDATEDRMQRAAREKCPECGGSKGCWDEDPDGNRWFEDCLSCKGTGKVRGA